MTIKSKLAAFAGALVLAGSAFAASQDVCPSIDAIKDEGLSMSEVIAANLFISYHISHYNTKSTWGFLMAPIESDNTETATDKANDILSHMSAPGVPQSQSGMVVCTYETGQPDVFAAAIQDSSAVTPLKLKQYFKQAH